MAALRGNTGRVSSSPNFSKKGMSARIFPISCASDRTKGETCFLGSLKSTIISSSGISNSATVAISPVCGLISEIAVSGIDPKYKYGIPVGFARP